MSQIRLQLRERLPQYSTVQDAIDLITSSRRIIVLTGAGISECGPTIPRDSRPRPTVIRRIMRHP